MNDAIVIGSSGLTTVTNSSISRKPGVPTQHFVIYDASAVNRLPYGVRLMRDGCGQQNDVSSTLILRLVASLRDSILHMPPVFRYTAGTGSWSVIPQFHSATNTGWTFAYTMQGLLELSSCIPGNSIDFSFPPTMEPLRVVDIAGEPVDISAWHAGVRCVAFYCLAILRALPVNVA
ncbi:hypothetical protein F5148DRAFT_1178838 [Russula earlei]|uniref:Uncharacterized protein n=1 Tax=Russula earlei TaxID=71964 RepID=A0ACC0UG54_9AGAM|nr:hypothetical protein F5148DRAFT_1178838 [Russula earlei]